MKIEYKIEPATMREVNDGGTIGKIAATQNLTLQIKEIPSLMVDEFHDGIREVLFKFGWDGSIG